MAIIEKKDILESIGSKLQKARRDKGFTQEYVAEQIDKSVDILRRIENGRSVGSVDTLLNICNVLEITLDYIFADLLNKKGEILDNKLYKDFQELDLKEKGLINTMVEYMKKNKWNKMGVSHFVSFILYNSKVRFLSYNVAKRRGYIFQDVL